MPDQQTRDRAGAILWILCVQFFIAEQVTSHAWTIPYSFSTNYVSDLGAVLCGAEVCSPLHAWMNASFVLQGVLIAGGAVLIRRWFPAYAAALTLLALSGVGVMVVGLCPEDAHGSLHRAGATVHFVAGGLGILTFGVFLLRDAGRRSLAGWVSVIMGIATLVASAMFKFSDTSAWGIGTVERVAAYAIPLWCMGMGTWQSRQRDAAAR